MKIINVFFVMVVLAITLLFMGCEDQASEFELEEYPVVEAYLCPWQAVDNNKVFKMSNFTDIISENNTISGLAIKLKVDSIDYVLSEHVDNPGNYYYSGSDLEIIPGMFCELEFEYNDKVISSETTIPGKTENLELSKTSISVTMGGWGGSGTELIEVTWDNPDNEYFYMVATNIEENPTPVHEIPEEEDDPPLSFGTQPATSNLLNIMPSMCMYYGTYELVIFKVNPEFAELSLYTTTNTINLTEPYTNIRNGKGIFTAFTSDTTYFDAVSK